MPGPHRAHQAPAPVQALPLSVEVELNFQQTEGSHASTLTGKGLSGSAAPSPAECRVVAWPGGSSARPWGLRARDGLNPEAGVSCSRCSQASGSSGWPVGQALLHLGGHGSGRRAGSWGQEAPMATREDPRMSRSLTGPVDARSPAPPRCLNPGLSARVPFWEMLLKDLQSVRCANFISAAGNSGLCTREEGHGGGRGAV